MRHHPWYAGDIRKQRFHSENASNVFHRNETITVGFGFVFEENSGRETT